MGSRDVVVSDAADTSRNLRAGPGLNHRVIARMPNGSWATIVQISGNWARVRHESGRVGRAWYHYLVRYVGEDMPAMASGPRGAIELRSGPDWQHRLLRSVNNATALLAGERRGDWFFLYRPDGTPLGWGPGADLARR